MSSRGMILDSIAWLTKKNRMLKPISGCFAKAITPAMNDVSRKKAAISVVKGCMSDVEMTIS